MAVENNVASQFVEGEPRKDVKLAAKRASGWSKTMDIECPGINLRYPEL
jgi:hypothetical protein